jgi:hypothetical protein
VSPKSLCGLGVGVGSACASGDEPTSAPMAIAVITAILFISFSFHQFRYGWSKKPGVSCV